MNVNLTISLTLEQFDQLKLFLDKATEIPIYSAGDRISDDSARFNRQLREDAYTLIRENPVLKR
jgi:hypothetical protein